MIYIKEAHPADGTKHTANEGKQLASNEKLGIIFNQPTTLGARFEVAETCSAKLDIKFPVLVDSIENKTATDYTAFPDRLYIIGTDGKIAYKSGPGPMGFKTTELTRELDRIIED